MEALRQEFSHAVSFRRVYVSEAHPADEWKIYRDIQYTQPRSLDEREAAARRLFAENASLRNAPLVLDGMDNTAEKAYAAHPERLYVIDLAAQPAPTVAFKGGMGPFDYDPEVLRQWLCQNVTAAGAGAGAAGAAGSFMIDADQQEEEAEAQEMSA